MRCTMARIRPVLVVLGKGCNRCNTLYYVATFSTVATKPDSTDEHAGGSERCASYLWLYHNPISWFQCTLPSGGNDATHARSASGARDPSKMIQKPPNGKEPF